MGSPLDMLNEMIEGIRRFDEPTEIKQEFYSRDSSRKVFFNSNFDLYRPKQLTGGTPYFVPWPQILMSFQQPAACDQPDWTLGTSTHYDPDFITILLRGHIGGLQLITNDKFISAEHRAVTKLAQEYQWHASSQLVCRH
ncbi:hypothetical protein RJ641_020473 [Dillenia turbinata]|uniref:Isopenicillin N synthase-like Fe(2+) 2OG dioxygenase domain-containing protein n=1 Tax=Dillenia turbinata TaxID=194707 RepID=A0AAN8UQ19_9MAGN